MGFGYLLLGFLIWLNPVHAELTEWLAYTLMLAGTTKLTMYGKGFKISNLIGFPALIISFVSFIFGGLQLIGMASFDSGILYNIIKTALLFLGYAYKLAFLYGIYEITKFTGIDKQSARAIYCMLVYALLFIFEFLMSMRIIPAISTGFALLLFASLIIGFVAFFIIFACLRMITLEGDEDEVEVEKTVKKSWIKKLKEMSEEDN